MRPWLLSAEGKRKGLYARIEKPDFKGVIRNLTVVTNKLIQPLRRHHALPFGIDIDAVRIPGSLAINDHDKPDGLAVRVRAENELQIVGMEPIDDAAIPVVQKRAFIANGLITDE